MFKLIGKMAEVYRDGLCALSCGLGICATLLIAGCSNTSSLPPVAGGSSATDTVTADPQVHEILAESCFDCHSDGATGPWNAKLAPSYLFGAHKAQADLNFSNWPALDSKQRSAIAAEITSVVANGSMPPGDYGFLHPSAKLNDEQKSLVLQWAREQTALAAH
jgi:Haem-binding domain